MHLEHFKLRTVMESDAEAIHAIYSPLVIGNSASFEVVPPSVDEIRERIHETIKTLPWIVCEYENKVVGYSYACQHRKREAYTWCVELAVYIHLDWHKKGIGMLLYSKLFDILRDLGYYNVYAGITTPNPGSIALHKKMGMTVVGSYTNVGFKQNKWHDVVWLQGTLQEHTVPPKTLKKFDSKQGEQLL